MDEVIDQGLAAFLERGCAMVIGTVSADGSPHAQRGWGCAVVGSARVRVLLDSSDAVLREHIDRHGRIAITSADVRTLRSVQLKGSVVGVESPGPEDIARCEQHNDELITDIYETDFYPRELTERMLPPGYVVAVVEVAEIFDQTPGPGAGARVASAP